MPSTRLVFLAALVASLCLTGAAELSTVRAQTRGDLSSFPFLELSPSARSAAMADAFGAVADGDVNALFYNPAVPGPSSERVPSFTYVNHVSDINAGSVAYSRTVRGLG